MSKLKVWGGHSFVKGKQYRTVVATTSQVKAARLVGESMYHFREYWCETWNNVEVATAMAKPGVVFIEVRPGEWV